MISSTSNPRVKNVTLLQKKSKERKEQGLFVTEGRKMFEEVLRDAPEAIAEVYVTEEYLAGSTVSLDGVSYEVVTENVMKAMAETLEPQGVIALVRMPNYQMEKCWEKQDGLWLALENLRDPGNLGTILRTAEAAGVAGILLSSESVDIYNPKVIRSTMGAIFRVPHFYTGDFCGELKRMRDRGATLYAAHLAGTMNYDEPDYEGRAVILIGNEANGLTKEASDCANCLVRIPMEGKAESLNAAVAAALLVYEGYRARRNRNKGL